MGRVANHLEHDRDTDQVLRIHAQILNLSYSEDDVKERCWDQRETLPGEPRCIICGCYGEYICDETDDDICSLECKGILLSRLAKSRKPTALPCTVKLPATDECYYVRDNDKSEVNPLTINQIELLRRKLDILVKGDTTPPPILSFASCKLPQKLLENFKVAGYEMASSMAKTVTVISVGKPNKPNQTVKQLAIWVD